MARYNEILVGRFNNALRKFLGMKGAAPAPQIGGEFMPVIPFNWGVETRFLEEWQRFSISTTQVGAAANNATLNLRNPLGSGVIAVAEKISVAAINVGFSSSQVRLGALNVDLGTIISLTTSRLDPRGRPQPTLILSGSTTNSGGLTAKGAMAAAFNTTIDFIWDENQEMPILPGDSLQILEGVVNQALTATILWRERALEESERQ